MEKWCRNQPCRSVWTRLPASQIAHIPARRQEIRDRLMMSLTQRVHSATLLGHTGSCIPAAPTWTTSPWLATGGNFTLVVERRTWRRFKRGTHTSEAARHTGISGFSGETTGHRNQNHHALALLGHRGLITGYTGTERIDNWLWLNGQKIISWYYCHLQVRSCKYTKMPQTIKNINTMINIPVWHR